MATLKVGVKRRTRKAVVDVPAGLPVGRYRVELVVAGRSGRSEPATLFINVVRPPIVRPPGR